MSAQYEMGVLRDCCGADWLQLLHKVLAGLRNEKSPYYILFVTQPVVLDGKAGTMTKALAPLRQLPTRDDKTMLGMLASMLYRVDNSRGMVQEIWTLPRDIPLEDAIGSYDQCIEDVASRAWALGMPIIHA